jgi:hypothetical protein
MPDDLLLSLRSADFSGLENFNVKTVFDDVLAAIAAKAIGRLDTLATFVQVQTEKITLYSALIVKGKLDGSLVGDELAYRLERLKLIIRGFIDIVDTLLVELVVAVWNAIVTVVWKAIGAAIKIDLPIPTMK